MFFRCFSHVAVFSHQKHAYSFQIMFTKSSGESDSQVRAVHFLSKARAIAKISFFVFVKNPCFFRATSVKLIPNWRARNGQAKTVKTLLRLQCWGGGRDF